jgi:hypothetical protein
MPQRFNEPLDSRFFSFQSDDRAGGRREWWRCRARSNEIPFNFVERGFLGGAVVKLRRACRGMVRHLRGVLACFKWADLRAPVSHPKSKCDNWRN